MTLSTVSGRCWLYLPLFCGYLSIATTLHVHDSLFILDSQRDLNVYRSQAKGGFHLA